MFKQKIVENRVAIHAKKIIHNREFGFMPTREFARAVSKKIYMSLDAYTTYPFSFRHYGMQGGIFNLEFNYDGRVLTAACERNSIMMIDAGTRKTFKVIEDAHSGCVNLIKYIDQNTFASCSDDTTICLWDMRNLNKPTQTLIGHSNWVKNLDYLESEHVLISSGFDGAIYSWYIDRYCENDIFHSPLFVLNDLMRTKMADDGSKLVLTSCAGYMLVIHNLNLETLHNDLRNIDIEHYKSLVMKYPSRCSAIICGERFYNHRKKNRVEMITQFPNKAKMISSLQLHPSGQLAVSRNINYEENQEWTALHDIELRLFNDRFANENEIAQEYARNRQSNGFLFGEHKLTNYIKERADGQHFIKEQCFSRDGLLICSPYDDGVRLLAIDKDVQEWSYCIGMTPRQLYVLTEMKEYHMNITLCCKFNPASHQLVTGSLSGEIMWYNPVFY